MSPLDFRDYQRRSRTFETFAAASAGGVVGLRGNLTGAGEPERVDLATVTANFFPLFGVTPAYGRNFLAEEEAPNGPHVVMLSDRLWRRRYGADPRLVGTTIQVDGDRAHGGGDPAAGLPPGAARRGVPRHGRRALGAAAVRLQPGSRRGTSRSSPSSAGSGRA